MNHHLLNKNYISCLKDILHTTFEDRKMVTYLLLGLFFLATGILCSLCVPLLLRAGVDQLSTAGPLYVPLVFISYGLLWMISRFFTHLRALLTYKIEQRITYVLGTKALSHLYNLSHGYLINQKPGAITNIIRRAQHNVPSLMVGIFFHALPILLEFLCVIILIGSLYSLRYSFFLGGILVTFFLYTYHFFKPVLKEREKANEIDKEADGIVTDWLSHHESVKTFGQKDLAIETCEKELKKREKIEVSVLAKYTLVELGQSCILGIGLIFLTYLVGQEVFNKTLTVGDFVLFNGYILQFMLPMSVLGQVVPDIKKSLVDMKGVLEILLIKSDIKEACEPLPLSGPLFSLEFRNVSFIYGNRVILKDVSFSVNPGEIAVIVGPTGIGKSTLAKLILRLYDPTEGQILINQVDLTQISLQSLYATIGWVPQESSLLNDTIENNLRFVCPGISLEDIERALEQANLLSFIRKLPEGLQTVVGNRGLKLSGGEKQRLSLARLFLKNPKICIFDEATSFLDRNTELTIQKNIETFFPDMTKIIITHRPFMINRANKIISLDKNSILKKEVAYEIDLKHNSIFPSIV